MTKGHAPNGVLSSDLCIYNIIYSGKLLICYSFYLLVSNLITMCEGFHSKPWNIASKILRSWFQVVYTELSFSSSILLQTFRTIQ